MWILEQQNDAAAAAAGGFPRRAQKQRFKLKMAKRWMGMATWASRGGRGGDGGVKLFISSKSHRRQATHPARYTDKTTTTSWLGSMRCIMQCIVHSSSIVMIVPSQQPCLLASSWLLGMNHAMMHDRALGKWQLIRAVSMPWIICLKVAQAAGALRCAARANFAIVLHSYDSRFCSFTQ